MRNEMKFDKIDDADNTYNSLVLSAENKFKEWKKERNFMLEVRSMQIYM